MTDSIQAIRDALAAGPSDAPFVVDNDCVYQAADTEMEYPIIHVNSTGFIRTEAGDMCAIDAIWFAACNPAAITDLLARLYAAEKDAERLREAAQAVNLF